MLLDPLAKAVAITSRVTTETERAMGRAVRITRDGETIAEEIEGVVITAEVDLRTRRPLIDCQIIVVIEGERITIVVIVAGETMIAGTNVGGVEEGEEEMVDVTVAGVVALEVEEIVVIEMIDPLEIAGQEMNTKTKTLCP